MPERTNSKCRLDSFPTSSVRKLRSRVMIWEAFATESLGRPVVRVGRSTLPGASAQRRLLVKGTQTTVLKRLRLSASPWTTNTGLRKPGSDPVGSGRLAQYTWPWAITTRSLRVCVVRLRKWLDRGKYRLPRRLCLLPRSRPQDRDVQRTPSRLPYKPGFVTSSIAGIIAPRHDRSYRGSRSQFSYPKYNWGDLAVQGNSVRAAVFVDKSVMGSKRGDLPVEQPKEFEFIINLKAAKQIELTIPPSVLYRADKVTR